MARTKKKKRFDFSDCILLKDPYALMKKRLSVAQICDAAQAALDKEFPDEASRLFYTYRNRKEVIDAARAADKLDESNWYQRKAIEAVFLATKEHKQEQTAALHAWYDGNADAQEVYRYACKDTNWWWYGDEGQVSAEIARARGWYERPADLHAFQQFVYGWKGTQYMELNREQVYMEGDIVVLRTPYQRNWRYDPHYNNSAYTNETPRYATVVSANNGQLASGRRGRGSRAISLIWFEKDGSISTIGEKYIKLHDRKGRAAMMKARVNNE